MQSQPAHDVGDIIGEPLIIHHGRARKEVNDRVRICSRWWGETRCSPSLPARVLRRQRQRIGVAALAGAQPESSCATSLSARWTF